MRPQSQSHVQQYPLYQAIVQVMFLGVMALVVTMLSLHHFSNYRNTLVVPKLHHHSAPQIRTTLTLTPRLSRTDIDKFLQQPVINPTPNISSQSTPHKCGDSVDLVFVVPTAPTNLNRRKRVRESDLYRFARRSGDNVTLFFFLGEVCYVISFWCSLFVSSTS